MYKANFERKLDYIIAGRIDIQCEILPVPFEKLSGMADGEPSAAIRDRIVKAREIQARRYVTEPNIFCNAQINTRLIKQHCALDDECQKILKHAMTTSARPSPTATSTAPHGAPHSDKIKISIFVNY